MITVHVRGGTPRHSVIKVCLVKNDNETTMNFKSTEYNVYKHLHGCTLKSDLDAAQEMFELIVATGCAA